eukprot:3939155-Rhodomonas_salina.2
MVTDQRCVTDATAARDQQLEGHAGPAAAALPSSFADRRVEHRRYLQDRAPRPQVHGGWVLIGRLAYVLSNALTSTRLH